MNKAAAATETRSFKMHPHLLYSVIERQAGTLTKAILEGVMNSVDARAKRCDVTITNDAVIIEDDGSGFQSRTDVEKFFEVFGQPHDEAENKTYGAFRMGRGQMFAFGHNQWTTGQFRMNVDIKRKGLDYALVENAENFHGCKIDISLYKNQKPSELNEVVRDIAKWVKYVSIPVTINGKLVSIDPAKAKWDMETDEAYINLKQTGSLTVYNLGVYVEDYAQYRFGMAGEIVSKQQLKVNFARNDIQSDCKVWRKIKPMIVGESARNAKSRKRRWTEDEKDFAAKQLLSGDITFDEARKHPLLVDVTGSDWSIERFISITNAQYKSTVSAAEQGNMKADKVMQSRMAFVLSEQTLERFDVETAGDLLAKLKEIYLKNHPPYYKSDDPHTPINGIKAIDFKSIASRYKETFDLLPTDKLSPACKVALEVLESAQYYIARHFNEVENDGYKSRGSRTLFIGKSDTAAAWTDGETYVAIDLSEIKGKEFSLEFWMRMAHLMIHEYCHREETSGSHVHNREFYEAYHNVQNTSLPTFFIQKCLEVYPRAAERHSKVLSKKVLKDQDKLFCLQQTNANAGEKIAAASK